MHNKNLPGFIPYLRDSVCICYSHLKNMRSIMYGCSLPAAGYFVNFYMYKVGRILREIPYWRTSGYAISFLSHLKCVVDMKKMNVQAMHSGQDDSKAAISIRLRITMIRLSCLRLHQVMRFHPLLDWDLLTGPDGGEGAVRQISP